MTQTNGTRRESCNRNPISFSDERRRDTLLRSAWVNIVSGFKCRPSPRSPWDEAATGDVTPWKYLLAPMRNAVLSAVETGDKQLIEQTLEGCRAFLREIEADVASLVSPNDEASLLALALDETKHQGPADEATMALAANPACPIAADRAVQPLERHHSRIAKLLEKCRRAARAPRTSSMAVVR